MALFTPRGLKLRLPTAYAFTLMARVYPRTDAFRVLQLTEEIENLGGLASFLATAAAFLLRLQPWQIALVVFVSVSLFRLIHLSGLFVPPFTLLLPLSRVYSVVSGYGVLFGVLLVLGFVTGGWHGVLAFLLARAACGALFGAVEVVYGRYVFKSTGIPVTVSERSFFHAYRLEASRLGVSTDLAVSDGEVAAERWKVVYQDLAMKWPVVVDRFTGDDS